MSLNFADLSQVIEDLQKDFFNPDNKNKFQDYIGVEKLSDEFLKLSLPRASDILNVAAGPGLLSAVLQKEGYGSIDALDGSVDNIVHLIKLGLYRNTICRKIVGTNSTGLKEDIYDAIVMVGGFSPENMSPNDLHEILRITKPDGHVLWTMRADYHNQKSDYGLIDENLLDLEKAGKCQIMKQAEKFQDQHSNMQGLFYMIKRTEKEEFMPDLSDVKVPGIVMDAFEAASKGDGGQGWEGDAVMVGQHAGYIKLCQAFFKLRLQRNVEILDVSSHMFAPGLVGRELSHNGYEKVDGLDHKLESLAACRDMKIYRNYILGHVGELGSIPVNDECYDVILMGGGFAPGQTPPSAFPELIRVLRPGGYIMWTMKDGTGAHDPDFALFDVKVQDLVLQRKWDILVGPVFFENFDPENAGRFYMLRKCHGEVFALGSPKHSPQTSPKLSRRRPSAY